MPDVQGPDPDLPLAAKQLQRQAITTLWINATRQIVTTVHKYLYHRTVEKDVQRKYSAWISFYYERAIATVYVGIYARLLTLDGNLLQA